MLTLLVCFHLLYKGRGGYGRWCFQEAPEHGVVGVDWRVLWRRWRDQMIQRDWSRKKRWCRSNPVFSRMSATSWQWESESYWWFSALSLFFVCSNFSVYTILYLTPHILTLILAQLDMNVWEIGSMVLFPYLVFLKGLVGSALSTCLIIALNC